MSDFKKTCFILHSGAVLRPWGHWNSDFFLFSSQTLWWLTANIKSEFWHRTPVLACIKGEMFIAEKPFCNCGNYCDFISDPTFGVLSDECLELIKKTPQFLKNLGQNFKKTLFLEQFSLLFSKTVSENILHFLKKTKPHKLSFRNASNYVRAVLTD